MKTTTLRINPFILKTLTVLAVVPISATAPAGVVNATYNAASEVPVTANGYTATGNTVNFTLSFAPATGTELMMVNNTGLAFINGTFDNLTNGQPVSLSYGGTGYNFVANYYGGSGNDLVLVWASQRTFACGQNYEGQIGDGTYGTNRLLPVPVVATGVLAGKTVVAISAGARHTLALCSDSTLAAWGLNDPGQLGDGTRVSKLAPVPVVSTGALAGKKVVAMAGGHEHSLALCSDGTVAAWGDNAWGEVGVGTMQDHFVVPVAVNTNSGVSALYGKNVVAIAAGGDHSLALCSDGTVAAWGINTDGQLGDNTVTLRRVPVAVLTNAGISALYGKIVVAIAGGSFHSLALCSDGTLVAWGENAYGQLGDGTRVSKSAPVPVVAAGVLVGKTVVATAGGSFHSLALCSDGTVAAWGCNDYGELGTGSGGSSPVPVAVNTAPGVSALYGKTVVAIGTGAWHSLALCSDGTLANWGCNWYGALGDGTTNQHNVPVAVNTASLPAAARFSRLACSPNALHLVALVAGSPATPARLIGPQVLAGGSFRFGFTNTAGAFFSVLAATNPGAPYNNWTGLAGLTEISHGQFQFTDPQAATNRQRFYRVHAP